MSTPTEIAGMEVPPSVGLAAEAAAVAVRASPEQEVLQHVHIALHSDPDKDSLESDSLAGDEAPAVLHQSSEVASATPARMKCFIDAAALGDGSDIVRPDVLPHPEGGGGGAARPVSPPAAAAPEVLSRLQQEERLKGSLLFSGSGCSTPEVLGSPQRRLVSVVGADILLVDRTDSPGAVFLDESGVGSPVEQQPDVVSAGVVGGAGRCDRGIPALDATTPDGSPSRRSQPRSLDEVPIVAGHLELTSPPTETPLRRAPDPQTAFFIDLNTLPAESPPETKSRSRRESDSVYLYIDLANEAPTKPQAAADAMSMSYHGTTAASQRIETVRERAATDAESEQSEEPASERTGATSLFYTVGDVDQPRRPPPQLKSRPPQQHRRRRNLSLDYPAPAERTANHPLPATHSAREERSPGVQRRPATSRSAGRGALPPRGPAVTTARSPAPSRPVDDRHHSSPYPASDAQSSTTNRPTRSSRVNSAPPRRRSAQQRRPDRPAAAQQPEPPKPQHTFLKSHSGRNAVSVRPAAAAGSRSAGAAAPGAGAGPPRHGSSSAGTLTKRKCAGTAAARQPAGEAPVRGSPPRESPASDDNASDVSSAKSYNRQSPETRSKQGIDQLTSDLLQMLSDGLHADVTIQVADQEVAAHRCILAARSQYFRQLLSKPQHNVVRIDGHRLETVEFVLFHLYSGATYVPEDVELSDLLTLAVMLQHKQLIRMAEFALRVRLCHMFHKPCDGCIPGVLETLCTAADCELDDLAARCLAWVTQNRVQVWADPSFAQMDDQYRAWCFQEAATLSEDTVLSVVQDCRRLCGQLSSARWATQVRDMVDTLLSNAVVFLSRHLGHILVSDRFLSIAERGDCGDLEQYLLAAADVQNGVDAHTSLEVIGQLQSVPNHGWGQEFLCLLRRLQGVCRRRATAGQNYASIHLQRRSAARATPPRMQCTPESVEPTTEDESQPAAAV